MFMQTLSGKHFTPADPQVSSIEIVDISHALSNLCRFAGHVQPFYSVAQHSVIVANIVKLLGGDKREQFHGLMHDATEAYLTDMPSPVKRLMADYRALEDKLYLVIAERFGLDQELPAIVKRADAIALATEAQQLMGNPDWGLTEKPAKIIITMKMPAQAKKMFVKKFMELGGEI